MTGSRTLRRAASPGGGAAASTGDEIKFYGVGDGDGVSSTGSIRENAASHQTVVRFAAPWRTLARRAAAAAGLDIFGGDVIVSPSGELTLIDLERLAVVRALPRARRPMRLPVIS